MRLQKKSKVLAVMIALVVALSTSYALVQIVNPPTSGLVFDVTEDVLFNYTLVATDTEGDSITFTDTSHDTNVSFYCFEKFKINDSASLINFTPTNEYVGLYSFEINARDPNDEIAAIVVYFNVSNSNDPPIITNTTPSDYAITSESGTLNLSINVHDDDLIHNDSLSFIWYLDGSSQNNTLKLNSTAINATTSVALYSPSIEDFDAHLHNISVFVSDRDGVSVNHAWQVNVTNVNRAPRFNMTVNNLTWPEDSFLLVNFSIMDHFYDEDVSYDLNQSCYYDPDIDRCLSFGYVLLNGTPGSINVSFSPFGNVSLIPMTDWFGTWEMRFSVDDGLAVNYSNLVILNVTNEPDPPVIQSVLNQSVYAYTNFTYQVIATDLDNDTLTYSVFSPGLSALTISPTGLLHLEAQPFMVNETFVNVTVFDGLFNSSIRFNFTIKNNSRPFFIPFPNNYISVYQHAPANVTINAFDQDFEVLDIWSRSGLFDEYTRVNDTSFNFAIYPVEQSLVGNHTILVKVNDTHEANNYYYFTLEVLDVPKAPILYDVAVPNDQLKINLSVNITVRAFDEDGNIVDFSDNTSSFEIITNSTGDENHDATGLIEFTPDSYGYQDVNVSVVDAGGLLNWTIFTFNVTGNHQPYFTSYFDVVCEQNRPCLRQFVGVDPDWQDTVEYNFSILNLTGIENFYIDRSGEISFTPVFVGIYYVDVWATDGILNETQTIMVNITKVNNRPVVLPSPLVNMTLWDNLTENRTSYFNISAFDIENLSTHLTIDLLQFTNLNDTTYTSGISFESQFTPDWVTHERKFIQGDIRNVTTWHFNLLPAWSEVGTYLINISVTDNTTYTSEEFSFDVINRNNRPVVNWSLNYDYLNLSVNSSLRQYYMDAVENTTIEIVSDAFERDYEAMSYSWFSITSNSSKRIVGRESSLSFKVPYYAYPNMTLILSVKDEQNASTNITWIMNVTNVNRDVQFGRHIYYFNSSLGSYLNMQVNDGSLQFAESAGSYSSFGVFTSEIIDFETYSHDLPRIDFETIEINDKGSGVQYDTMLETAASREYTETMTLWNLVDSTNEIRSDEYRYFALRLSANSSNTSVSPNISNVIINYDIHSLNVPTNQAYRYWINLNHFFKDPDLDDELTFDYEILSGEGLMNVTLEKGYIVTLTFLKEGTVYLVFNATDPFGSSVLSNVINVTIESSDAEDSRPTTSTGGGVTIRTEYKYKTVQSPISLDIIHPESVTVYENETAVIPIKLINNEQFNFKDLTISAVADREGLDVTLDTEQIALLPFQDSETVLMTLNMTGVYDSYGVYVSVNVSEPEYQDTAKIMISSLKRLGNSEESQKMKFAFVKDLLSKNKECTELSEYIDRARIALEDGEYELADQLLESFINDCKLLIQDQSPISESPTVIEVDTIMGTIFKNKENLAIALALVSATLLVLIFVIILAYKRI